MEKVAVVVILFICEQAWACSACQNSKKLPSRRVAFSIFIKMPKHLEVRFNSSSTFAKSMLLANIRRIYFRPSMDRGQLCGGWATPRSTRFKMLYSDSLSQQGLPGLSSQAVQEAAVCKSESRFRSLVSSSSSSKGSSSEQAYIKISYLEGSVH